MPVLLYAIIIINRLNSCYLNCIHGLELNKMLVRAGGTFRYQESQAQKILQGVENNNNTCKGSFSAERILLGTEDSFRYRGSFFIERILLRTGDPCSCKRSLYILRMLLCAKHPSLYRGSF